MNDIAAHLAAQAIPGGLAMAATFVLTYIYLRIADWWDNR